MASPADNDQRKRDLELLALFDSNCLGELSTYESVIDFSSETPESAPPAPSATNSNEISAMDTNENENENENENVDVDVANWMKSLDENTLAYIDDIIATNAAAKNAAPSSSDVNDAAFSFPRKYKCPMCPKDFFSRTAMQKHGRRHILKQIKCPCGFRGQSPVQKHKHYLYHHVGMPKQKFLASF